MAALTDDDRMESLLYQSGEGLVGAMDERTRGFGDLEALRPDGLNASRRSAVGGDDDVAGGDLGGILTNLDSPTSEVSQHGFVMDEIAQYGDRPLGRVLLGEGDGVADAKAHAEMVSAQDLHERKWIEFMGL